MRFGFGTDHLDPLFKDIFPYSKIASSYLCRRTKTYRPPDLVIFRSLRTQKTMEKKIAMATKMHLAGIKL